MTKNVEISTYGAVKGFGVDGEVTAAGIEEEKTKSVSLSLEKEEEMSL